MTHVDEQIKMSKSLIWKIPNRKELHIRLEGDLQQFSSNVKLELKTIKKTWCPFETSQLVVRTNDWRNFIKQTQNNLGDKALIIINDTATDLIEAIPESFRAICFNSFRIRWISLGRGRGRYQRIAEHHPVVSWNDPWNTIAYEQETRRPTLAPIRNYIT